MLFLQTRRYSSCPGTVSKHRHIDIGHIWNLSGFDLNEFIDIL